MILGCFKISSLTFKAICSIAAGFMIGFWIFKYHENEDVSAVEYVSYETQTDLAYPVLSVCTFTPFIYQNLFWNSSAHVSANEYNRYIHGLSAFREEYKGIIFDNVTLNLLEHVQEVVIKTRNEKDVRKLSCNDVKNCSYIKFKINYEGTKGGYAIRCVGFEVHQERLGAIDLLKVIFKPNLIDMLTKAGKGRFGPTVLVLNYPGQIMKSMRTSQQIWKNPHEPSRLLLIKVRAMEVLRRRSKTKEPCLADWAHYDDMVLKKHESKLTCSPPYRKSGKPSCTTRRELEDSVYEMEDMTRNYKQEPCKEMSSIVFKAEKYAYASHNESLQLMFKHPLKAKVIKQIKSVDFQALIGNIGGYIGLFLGKKY